MRLLQPDGFGPDELQRLYSNPNLSMILCHLLFQKLILLGLKQGPGSGVLLKGIRFGAGSRSSWHWGGAAGSWLRVPLASAQTGTAGLCRSCLQPSPAVEMLLVSSLRGGKSKEWKIRMSCGIIGLELDLI